jgi:hypothetical protein
MEQAQNWVSEYVKHMLADDPENGIPLKLAHFPDSFFRYRILNDKTLMSLENNEDR